MKANYTVKLLASYHKKEATFEYDDYKNALSTFKDLAVDSADFIAVLANGSAMISIIAIDGQVVRSLTISAIKPD